MTVDAEYAAVTREFLEEGFEILDRMEDAAIALEEDPTDAEVILTIFRGAHTLKGNASCLELAQMTHAAHELENVIDRLRARKEIADPDIVTIILRVVDAFRESLPRAIEGHDELSAPMAAALATLRSWTGTSPDVAASSTCGPGTTTYRATTSLRVDAESLDQIVNLAGELAIARGRLARELEKSGAGDCVLEAFGESERLSQQIQELATRLRMVPVGTVFRPLFRAVRDLASAEGKKARLIPEGSGVDVDLSVVEHLRDPLMHMIRNAVDHGIERPEIRALKGKPPEGTITLRARHEAGSIVIDVADDGAGFDRDVIKARGLELGIDVAKLSDRDLLRLILEPGFSTAREVTEISGRGVGLDVVRRNVEALRGWIDIAGDDAGAHFTLRLPLTLAIIDGFGVGAGDESFIIPLSLVVECIESPALAGAAGSGIVDLRGEPLPVISLAAALGLPSAGPARHIVVLDTAAGRAGLAVDRLDGLQQSVIKPLGRFMGRQRDFSGSSILSDGRVALVLDVNSILQRAARCSTAGENKSCD